VILDDREAAALLMPRLEGFASLIDGWYLTCIARHLGAAAALLGDKSKAMAYNQQALEVAGKVRFRPEIALIRLQMAELLLDDADAAKRTEAHAHLDFAIGEFRAMKMQPALERALRHKDLLKA
jgi:hypothetical protein